MKRIRCASLLAAACFFATTLCAQTTGRIEGRTHDNAGAALPGVTVVATSPELQGESRVSSGDDGTFRLVNLPPGVYTVTASLDGFNTIEQRAIKVGIDRTVKLDLSMSAAFGSEVTVLGDAPVVDTARATSGVSVSSETFDQLPLARNFYAVAQLATGSSTDAAGTSFYGSTGAENEYLIEGLNTTGSRLGTTGKTLNFDFIQEVEVKTGGLPAEYGRLTGGLINAITKSGGNDFEGNVFGFYQDASANSTASRTPETQASVTGLDHQYDYGFALGGAFVRDKLWFFGAYDRQSTTNQSDIVRAIPTVAGFEAPPAVGSMFDTATTTNLYSGKLTWRTSTNHSLALSLIGDPSTADGNVFPPIAGPVTTFDGKNETGGNDYLLRYDGVVGSSWVFEALGGLHKEKSTFSGAGTEIPLYIDRTGPVPFPLAGGFGYYENQRNERDVLKADVSKFLGSKLELKFGADQEKVSVVTDRFNGGVGQRIYIFNNRLEPGGPLVYRHRYYVDLSAPGFDHNDPSTWRPLVPLHVEPETTNTAAYAQASWKPLANLTFNLGLRWEEQKIGAAGGVDAIKLDDNYAPRLQFIWDPQGKGRAKLFGSWGRYYESVPMDINVRAFGGEAICFCYNYSPDPAQRDPLPVDEIGFRSSLLGGATPVDPNLKGQYIDEALLGYEYEVAPNFVLGVQATYRNLGRVIEDFLVSPTEGYFVANPGEGLGTQMTFYDYSPAPGVKAERTYKGLELDARKRYSNGWQLYASYLWSRLEGNYDGVFQASTGQLDPNINSAFDYADFMINAKGKLSNDRTHTVKLDTSYSVQGGILEGLSLGLSTYWRSGTPLTAYGYSFGYSNWEYYLTPRGSLGRGPSDYEASVHLGYPIKIGGNELQVLLDVFNLLDRQTITTLDQRYNLDSQGPCAGIPDDICGAGGGLQHRDNSLTPVAQLPDPRATATNQDFLRRGTAFTGQRTIRLGLRYRF